MFLLNSRMSLFIESHLRGHPFFRSYGAILPSSLARVLSSALGYSPHLPVSVYGTNAYLTHMELFLGSKFSQFAFSVDRAPHHLSPLTFGVIEVRA